MGKWLAFLMILGSLAVPVSHAAGSDPYKDFFNESFGDFAEELTAAKAQGKKGILVFFEMDECPFCHYMKSNVLNRPDIQVYYREHFLNFAVDIEGDLEITDFAGKKTTQKQFAETNRVRATPVIAFFGLDGKPLYRHTGRTASPEEFFWLGEYVAGGDYKGKPFITFKREKKSR